MTEGLVLVEEEQMGHSRVVIIGDGTMGSRMGEVSGATVLGRESDNYQELVQNADVVILATKQQDALDWAKQYGSILSESQTLVSLVGFVDFELLEMAMGEHQCGMVRMMTDTSLNAIVWSDDGKLIEKRRQQVESTLAAMGGEIVYAGKRNDETVESETLLACVLGWLAQELVLNVIELEGMGHTRERANAVIDQKLRAILTQREEGLSYEEIFEKVATKGGVTEAGAQAVMQMLVYLLHRRTEAALSRRSQIQDSLKKGLEADAN